MPDLVTHLASAYLLKKFTRLSRGVVLFYLGALLPDLLSRPLHLVWPVIFPATQPLHSPVGAFLSCWLISLFFRSDQRKSVFFLLFSGSLLHFCLDILQRHLLGGYLWLFPFSVQPYSLGCFWPEDALSVLPYTLLVVLIVYLISAWWEKKRFLK